MMDGNRTDRLAGARARLGCTLPTPTGRRRSGGFTLVELLVVIAIIGILVSLLLPAIQAARAAARRTECANNFKNLGLAIQSFVASKGYYPAASTGWSGSNSKPRHSLITLILPYFEQGNLYRNLDLNYDWNDTTNSNNKTHARQHLGGILTCPSAPPGRETDHVSDYAPVTGINRDDITGIGTIVGTGKPIVDRGLAGDPNWRGILRRDKVVGANVRVTSANVRDGLSNTFLLVEDAGRPREYVGGVSTGAATGSDFRWANWQLYIVIDEYCGQSQLFNCTNSSEIYGFHSTGTNFLMGDGSVHFLDVSIDADLFVSLLTASADEDVTLP